MGGGLFFQLDEKLADALGALGYRVGQHPWSFIVVPFFVVALFATGFQRMVYESDFEKLLIPSGAACLDERALIEFYYPMNFTDFMPDRATHFGRYVTVLAYAADGGDIFRQGVFSKVVRVHEALTTNLTIGDGFEGEGRVYYWQDLCSKRLGKCYENSVLQLADVVDQIESGESPLSYPFTFHPESMETIILAGSIANPVLNPDDTVKETKAVQLQYFLDAGSPHRTQRSLKWEKAALALLETLNNSAEFSDVSIFYVAESSLGEEMDSLIWHIIPKLGITAALILSVAAVCTWSPVWRESKMTFGLAGAAGAALGCAAGMGLLFYLGVPMTSGALATPFLILGIGMDDCFVLLSFWRKTNPHDSVPKRLAQTYRGAAVSITITSVTNALSFAIGCITPFFMARLFCMHTGACVVAVYLLGITFLGGVLALTGYKEAEHLQNSSSSVAVMSPGTSEAVALSITGSEKHCSIYDSICDSVAALRRAAGTGFSSVIVANKDPPAQHRSAPGAAGVDADSRRGTTSYARSSSVLGRKGSQMQAPSYQTQQDEDEIVAARGRHFFRPLSNFLAYKCAKAAVILLMLGYWAGAMYGLSQTKEGASTSGMVADDSYYASFFHRQSYDFMDFAVRIPVVLIGDFDYWDPKVQSEIENITVNIERSHPALNDDLYTDSWLRGFLQFVKRNEELGITEGMDVTKQGNFTSLLKNLYLTEDSEYKRDVVFGENGRIQASRFVFQARHLENMDDSRFIMQALRSLFAKELKDYNITSYHPLYRFGEQFDAFRWSALTSILAALATMVIVALFFLPDWRCAMWVGLSVFSIELGVTGYMCFFGINLDAVSLGILIMCIGFSVDYSAHVSHAYLHSKAEKTVDRVDDALAQVGIPILQGALSTFLAIAALFLIPAYIMRTFFTCTTLVVVFGALHGLLFLPVLFSIFIGVPKSHENQPGLASSGIKLDEYGSTDDAAGGKYKRRPGQARRNSVLASYDASINSSGGKHGRSGGGGGGGAATSADVPTMVGNGRRRSSLANILDTTAETTREGCKTAIHSAIVLGDGLLKKGHVFKAGRSTSVNDEMLLKSFSSKQNHHHGPYRTEEFDDGLDDVDVTDTHQQPPPPAKKRHHGRRGNPPTTTTTTAAAAAAPPSVERNKPDFGRPLSPPPVLDSVKEESDNVSLASVRIGRRNPAFESFESEEQLHNSGLYSVRL